MLVTLNPCFENLLVMNTADTDAYGKVSSCLFLCCECVCKSVVFLSSQGIHFTWVLCNMKLNRPTGCGRYG